LKSHIHARKEYAEDFCRAIGEAHRRYTRQINFREKWKGQLWQGRFSSFMMDETYLFAATRYIELNPVKAELVSTPEEYQWSSAKAHMDGKRVRRVRSILLT